MARGLTVIREVVEEEARQAMAGLLGPFAPRKPAKNGRRRRRRGPGPSGFEEQVARDFIGSAPSDGVCAHVSKRRDTRSALY
jgi:hypothetical protein